MDSGPALKAFDELAALVLAENAKENPNTTERANNAVVLARTGIELLFSFANSLATIAKYQQVLATPIAGKNEIGEG